jgi:hypothetical protein
LGIEHEVEAKQADLQRKKKILLMLQVLEKRETLRVQRFEELGRLLVDLRYVFGIGMSD